VKELTLSEVRRDLPSLIDEVLATGEEIVIKRRGKPVARLGAYVESEGDRYPLRGLGVWMSDDFDEPMQELWEKLAN